MENKRKHRYIKFITNEATNYLVSEPNYDKFFFFFSKNVLAIEMKKTHIHMNKPVYLGLLILELSKTVMYEFWYD